MGRNNTGGLNEAYGQRHRDARAEKIKQIREKEGQAQCEVTGETEKLCAHHAVPRLFNGADIPSNYQLLQADFHQRVLHASCNVTNPDLVKERVILSRQLVKHILDEEKHQQIKEHIDFIDDQLIEEYIFNMLNKLQHQYREKVIHLTLVNSFKSVRDLHIENIKLRAEMQQMQAKMDAHETSSEEV